MADQPNGERWAEPVLELSTLLKRPFIIIDERMYDIRSPDELSAVEHQRLAAWGRRIDELMQKDDLTAPQNAELQATVQQLSDFIMVGVPEELRAKLSDDQRLQVTEAFFTKLLLRRRLKAAAASVKEALKKLRGDQASTGERPPPDSSASTAATRDGGSTEPRSRSSAPIS